MSCARGDPDKQPWLRWCATARRPWHGRARLAELTNAQTIGVGFGTASETELPISLPAHARYCMGEETRGALSPSACAALLCLLPALPTAATADSTMSPQRNVLPAQHRRPAQIGRQFPFFRAHWSGQWEAAQCHIVVTRAEADTQCARCSRQGAAEAYVQPLGRWMTVAAVAPRRAAGP